MSMKDGWIEWKGGERPVGPDVIVDVRFRAGDVRRGPANEYYWRPFKNPAANPAAEIIAYRLAALSEEGAG